ncbi:MAG: 23S rRNA (pseudouridine(1915)-N(3))-methyltransferase RlmH [Rhodobiaceae bacterium]|nr:23S rRNA (pseudouridine(1915)-N(3))-methyltransferase RlmH [Rhodobiaceae bacterium]MCC0016230.1 23S rRNA (pseudouridine(1915)-N(3))-methyltransferase RlmH [Rhodobiaceae bacterium]MCC0041165.1 23S rRNA (pseudouridine(1915)-N(3))-methyltransferase RlmH [Rhodobiaceae bacterium]
MRVRMICVGRLKSGPERTLCADYLDRFAAAGRSLGLSLGDTVELDESRNPAAARRKAEEAAAIAAKLNDGGNRLVVLDEGGRMVSSTELAGKISDWRDGGTGETAFVIGGPDGLDPALLAQADERIAFGRMTWPHRLVRIMLAEQLYRIATILSGHPYHRA